MEDKKHKFPKWWPDAHWGTVGTALPEAKGDEEDTPDDDEELEETPPDIIEMLGFDPADLDFSEDAEGGDEGADG